MKSVLFEPIRIRNMAVANRFIRSGSSERASAEDGKPTDALLGIYEALARGGVGLLITGFAYVRLDGRSTTTQNGIWNDSLTRPWSRITGKVHALNADLRIVMQIVHGGRQCLPESVPNPIAPSAVRDGAWGSVPRAMTEDEIDECIRDFGRAALRVKLANFDGVQIHAAHGYLISEFLSSHTNLRHDRWGGSLENRMRFLVEVYKGVRREVGEEYPVLMKINGSDYLENGLNVEESAEVSRRMSELGIDLIEVSGTMAETKSRHATEPYVVREEQEGYFLDDARVIKSAARVPVSCAGGFRSKVVMERAIERGQVDMVSLARPFIAEPDLVNLFAHGRTKAMCNSCNKCLDPTIGPIRCPEFRG